jgi:membrane-associated protease RseP (regulator of RpoE activity)
MKLKVRRLNRFFVWALIVATGISAVGQQEDPTEVLQLLGGIVAKNGTSSVALVKHRPTASIKAIKVGEMVFGVGRLLYVDRYEMRIHRTTGSPIVISSRFAGEKNRLGKKGPTVNTEDRYIEDGFQRIGNQITVDSRYRDRIVREELPKVLMEASSEPVMENGQIVGFRLFQFEENSMFHKLGMKDGDVVTEINGVPLNNVTRTVQLLNGLRGENAVKVKVVRNGTPTSLDLSVK